MILLTGDKLALVQGSAKPLLQGLSQRGAAAHQDARVQTDARVAHHLTGPAPVFPEGWDVHNDNQGQGVQGAEEEEEGK